MDMANEHFLVATPRSMDNIFEYLDNIGGIQTHWSPGQEVHNAPAEPIHQIDSGNSTEVTQPLEVPNAAAEPAHQTDGGNISEVMPPLTKRRRKLFKSKVWDMFEKVKDPENGKEWAVCRNCKKKYVGSSKMGTSNLLKHMEKCPQRGNCNADEPTETVDITTPIRNREHGVGDKCPEKGDETASVLNQENGVGDKPAETGDMTTVLNRADGAGEKSSHEMVGVTIPVLNREKYDDQELRLTMARMIIKHTYPLSMVKKNSTISEYFQADLQPILELKKDGSLQADILHIYKEGKEKLCRSLNKSTSGRFSLTIYLWRRDTIVAYCCLTLQFINDSWDMKQKILDFKKIKPCYDSRESCRTFKNMLQDWSIGKNNLCCITAQHTNEVDFIVSEIKNQEHSHSNRKLFHINCFVNILNLLLEDGLQEVKDLFDEIWICINVYIRGTPENEDNFKTAVAQIARTGKKVNYEDISPSWKLSFQTLGRVLGLREAFLQFENMDLDFVKFNPRQDKWDKAALIYECLTLIDDAVRSLTESRCLTTNVYFPEVCNINKKLYRWGESVNSDVRKMACKMRARFDKYWKNSSLVLGIAVVLDPRFKFDIVECWYKEIYGSDAQRQWRKVEAALKEAYNEYARLFGDASSSTPYVTDHFGMLDSLGMLCTSSHDFDDEKYLKSELERYLEESKFRPVKEFDILGWWRVNTPNFPTLSKMARDFLAVPVTAAQSNPSFHDEVMKVDRSFLDEDPDIIEALICAKDWFQND